MDGRVEGWIVGEGVGREGFRWRVMERNGIVEREKRRNDVYCKDTRAEGLVD